MDVAALALKIDSSDLVRASAELDKFSAAASKAGATAGRAASDGAEKMSRGMSRSAQNAVTAAASVDRYAGATSGAAASAAQAAQAAMRSAQAASSSGAAARASTSGWDLLTGSLNSNFVAINKNLQALNLVPAAAARSRAALNDNVSAMQATPGNIAAQFQDIGVTAAMGMNPLLIALQQGTQLSAAFAGGGLKSLGAAFRELASPAALLTIGIVGLVAALIQMVDWTALAQSALYGLANILVDIAPYAVAAAAALALIYAPAIMTGIITLTKIIYGLAAGLLAVIPIPVLIVAGLTAIVAAAVHFRDELTQYFGFDIVQTAQDGVNHIVGVFVGGYNGIRQAWGQLPAALGDIAIRAANATLRAVENMVNGTISLINGLTSQLPFGLGKSLNIGDVSFGQIDNPFAGAEASFNGIVTGAIAAAQQVDWVGRGVATVRDLAAQAANKLREWAKALGASDEKKKGGGKTDADRLVDILRNAEAEIAVEQNRLKAVGMSARAAAELEQRTKILNQVKKAGIPITAALRTEIDRLSKAYADAKIAADTAKAIQGVTDDLAEQKRAIADEIALIGVYGDALSRARREQDLLNAARDALPRGETLSPAVEQAIKAGAGEISDAETRRDELQRMADLKKDAEDAAYALELERGALGLTGAAAIKYAFIAERLNDAKREGIEMSPQEVAAIKAAGAAYAQQRYAIDQAADAIADAREVTRGFFADWINGAREGQSMFRAFADSAVNSLNRIIDKLLDRTLDGFLDNLFTGGLGFLGGGSSGSELGGAVMNLSSARPNALGGAYGPGGIERFAKGGAFTNSIVSTPTLFRFANGAALGEMGEAGPEAIMPLKRGPNGALGVQALGGGSRRAEININNEYRIEGAVTPDMILAMIKQGGDATYDQVKRDLQALLQEWDTGGAVAT
ncbi:phage tail length tape measure family protein [Pelagerythrobacter marinus]|nr:phage tail length tape measure family protein [Pelagerythrobacter marinus]